MMKITSATPIGLVGLGNMGRGVAENLLRCGFSLTVHERSEKVRHWGRGRNGVRLTPDLKEVGKSSQVILLTVTDNSAIEEVLFSKRGVLAGLRRGGLVIDMTTGDPELAVRNQKRLTNRGFRMLEAPMTGGAVGAMEGTLLLMVGGDQRLCKDCQPLFSAFSRKVVYAGGAGMGQKVKLLQNQLSFTLFLATCEALWAGKTLGFDPALLIDVFQNSNARSYETELRFPRFILSKTFQSGAAIRVAYKDLKLITDLEKRLKINLPMALRTRQYWELAMERIGGQADFTEVYKLVQNKKELQSLLGKLGKKQGPT
jgi:3-hydroxyisobutyrate dehydrogenase